MGIIKRFLYIIFAPVFMIYIVCPPLWILNIPYWIITDRDLMDDLCKIYGV